MIYFAKRHFGAAQIVFGCVMFPAALALVNYHERLFDSYGVFDNSLSGRFDSFIYNTIGLQVLMWAAVGAVVTGFVAIASGMWYASSPTTPPRR